MYVVTVAELNHVAAMRWGEAAVSALRTPFDCHLTPTPVSLSIGFTRAALGEVWLAICKGSTDNTFASKQVMINRTRAVATSLVNVLANKHRQLLGIITILTRIVNNYECYHTKLL
jgi:hypothetical protein